MPAQSGSSSTARVVPTGIQVIAVFNVLLGMVLMIVGGIGGWWLSSQPSDASYWNFASVFVLVFLFAIVLSFCSGALLIVAGAGLLRLKNWAWYLTVVLAVVNVWLGLGGVATTTNWLARGFGHAAPSSMRATGILAVVWLVQGVAAGWMLWYLAQTSVRKEFQSR
jgi:hypothetical protein